MAAERWWAEPPWPSDLAPYLVVIRAFVDERLNAAEFECLYLAIFKNDPVVRPWELFSVLDSLFADVDDFCDDEELREQVGGIDEGELRRRAQKALAELADVSNSEAPSP